MATFCLIHGNWHDGSCWAPLIGPLRERGHDAVAPDLPLEDPAASWEERIDSPLRALDGVEGQVVVVAHSASSGYGALVADRLSDPLLVHLCPRLGRFPAPPDAPPVFRPGFPFPPRRADGANVWDPEAAIPAMYPRLPRDTAEQLAGRLRPAAPPAGAFPLPSHPEVRTALIYATDDEFFEPDWERFMARNVLGIEPVEIDGGHFPMLEDPESLAAVLDPLVSRSPRA